ncbi:MAG TPA: helix-turn-helix domain-containing protein [Acidimicrobiia bacterium]|nr:helix-turn-helix domain-containing protein [Acidimicrobiia bacterium]
MANTNTSADASGNTSANTEDLPPILDAAQVADLLGMNVQMVRKYAREGRLPAYKLPGGRTFKFFRDEIFETLRANPVTADDVEDEETVAG